MGPMLFIASLFGVFIMVLCNRDALSAALDDPKFLFVISFWGYVLLNILILIGYYAYSEWRVERNRKLAAAEELYAMYPHLRNDPEFHRRWKV